MNKTTDAMKRKCLYNIANNKLTDSLYRYRSYAAK